MYRFIFSMIVALALAAVMSALFGSPASAQCRAGACRAQFGRARYVYRVAPPQSLRTTPTTNPEIHPTELPPGTLPNYRHHQAPQAHVQAPQKATAERGGPVRGGVRKVLGKLRPKNWGR